MGWGVLCFAPLDWPPPWSAKRLPQTLSMIHVHDHDCLNISLFPLAQVIKKKNLTAQYKTHN